MIIAAAVKFMIPSTGNEVVLCANRHCNVFNQLKLLGFNPKQCYIELEQGFIDHDNNFLSRTEAYYHAKKCNQLSKEVLLKYENQKDKEIFSEDLW